MKSPWRNKLLVYLMLTSHQAIISNPLSPFGICLYVFLERRAVGFILLDALPLKRAKLGLHLNASITHSRQNEVVGLGHLFSTKVQYSIIV